MGFKSKDGTLHIQVHVDEQDADSGWDLVDYTAEAIAFWIRATGYAFKRLYYNRKFHFTGQRLKDLNDRSPETCSKRIAAQERRNKKKNAPPL